MLSSEPDGETGLILTRIFDAPPEALWRAHADPALVRQWLLGPEGWEITTCQLDARAGGAMALTWSNGMNSTFSITGEIVEADPPHHMLHVERMHLPDPTPDMVVETVFEPEGRAQAQAQVLAQARG